MDMDGCSSYPDVGGQEALQMSKTSLFLSLTDSLGKLGGSVRPPSEKSWNSMKFPRRETCHLWISYQRYEINLNLKDNILCESFGTEVSGDRLGGPGTSTRCDTSLVAQVEGNNSNTGRQSWHHRPYRPKPEIRRRSERESEPRHGLQRTATPQQWTLKAARHVQLRKVLHTSNRES